MRDRWIYTLCFELGFEIQDNGTHSGSLEAWTSVMSLKILFVKDVTMFN